MNPLLYCDFYKLSHRQQYPKGITRVFSNWTPRSSRLPEEKGIIHFGLQYFIKKILIEEFNNNFFNENIKNIVQEYKNLVRAALGDPNPKTDHIEALYDYGKLPINIYSIPEGSFVPLGIPAVVIVNTHPDFFWLPNYLETILSTYLWKAATSATTALRYRKILMHWANKAADKDILIKSLDYINYQAHDFSMRGMSGLDDVILSGMGHLTCFNGTDSIPAILAANEYYNAGLGCGGSVPATEHSVMCAGEQDGELETFRRLIEDIYPNGIVSIVSDTWDLWKVCTEYIPALKDKIEKRDGIVVLRPDSGNPEHILCGNPTGTNINEHEGVLRLLAKTMGVDASSKLINKMRAIYGDSITPERANKILDRTVNELGLSPANVVFGVGSYTYEYVTRDTYGFAMKATAIEKDGKIIPIFKKPITDSGTKHSRKGLLAVYKEGDSFVCKEEATPYDLDHCAYEKVFEDGTRICDYQFQLIRDRVRSYASPKLVSSSI